MWLNTGEAWRQVDSGEGDGSSDTTWKCSGVDTDEDSGGEGDGGKKGGLSLKYNVRFLRIYQRV